MAVNFDNIEPEARRVQAQQLDVIFQDVTGFKPQDWDGIVGYGRYHYTYKSGRKGIWFATGFALRSRGISIYISPGYATFDAITARLGKHKAGKACYTANKLADLNEDALRDLIRAGLDDLATQWPIEPT
ncbi:MAG: DUF1801 domain-containing protein [Pseudomonadota bacterium]